MEVMFWEVVLVKSLVLGFNVFFVLFELCGWVVSVYMGVLESGVWVFLGLIF